MKIVIDDLIAIYHSQFSIKSIIILITISIIFFSPLITLYDHPLLSSLATLHSGVCLSSSRSAHCDCQRRSPGYNRHNHAGGLAGDSCHDPHLCPYRGLYSSLSGSRRSSGDTGCSRCRPSLLYLCCGYRQSASTGSGPSCSRCPC